MRKILKNITNAVKATYMCIKYPFLYPRNRFTGLHYNNWTLHQYHTDNYRNAVSYVIIKHINKCDLTEDVKPLKNIIYVDGNVFNTHKLTVKGDGTFVYYRNNKEIYREKVSSERVLVRTGIYAKEGGEPTLYIVYTDDFEIPKEKKFHIHTYKTNKWLYFKIKVADFLNYHVLQLFHCIPTYTEWDAMKSLKGWNAAFGEELLREMKKQLKKDKMLYSFRITDIKEKFGSLRIYCGAATSEMYALLNKYENISYHTCIVCGKPAKYLSGGWICPYCEEHFDTKKEIPYATMVEGKWIYDERS